MSGNDNKILQAFDGVTLCSQSIGARRVYKKEQIEYIKMKIGI